MTIRAILTPPQEEAFREMCGVGSALETHFHGWSKRVILTSDRVFLFPRDHTRVSNLDREAAALEALHDCGRVPGLIARHQDDRISPYLFLELERVAGSTFHGAVYEGCELSIVFDLMAQLGQATAEWHERSTQDLMPVLREPFPRPRGFLEQALQDDPGSVATEAANALEISVREDWIEALAAVQVVAPVLTHGDVHGEQLMTEQGKLTGVIDWETASIDNPVRDFHFREWGLGWYRVHERDFSLLRERLWTSYADARPSASLPDWRTVNLFFSLIEAWECASSVREFDIERRQLTRAILMAARPRE